MARYMLKKVVTTSTVWEVEADSVDAAVHSVENMTGKQIGWEQRETAIRVVSESMIEDRPLVEGQKQFKPTP